MKGILINNLHFGSRLEIESDPARSSLYVSTPPLGILLLSSILQEKKTQVEVVDFADLARAGAIPTDNSFYERAARRLAESGPDWVGFTTRCDNYHCALRIARELKRCLPEVPLIFGGPQATVTDVETLRLFPQVDYIIRNEAEDTLPELLNMLATGGNPGSIAGLSWRSGMEVIRNADRALIKDLDAYPLPDYALYTRDFSGRWPIEVGRGCPFGCTFCSTNVYFSRSYRLKSGPRLVQEIRNLMENYGAREFHFIHDMFTVDKRRVFEICRVLEEANLEVAWDCSARLDCINDEIIHSMRRAGCDFIYMGIETGSQKIQKVVKKNLKLQELEPKVGTLKKAGYGVITSFIAGFEDETLEDVADTLECLVNCVIAGVDIVQLHLCAPLRGAASYSMNKGNFAFDGYFSDQVDPIFFLPEDQELIKTNEEVFSAFYYVRPKHLPRTVYHGLDFFGYAMQHFRYTLYYILKTSSVTPLKLFQGLKERIAAKGIDISSSSSLDMSVFYALFIEHVQDLIRSGVLIFPYLSDVLQFDVDLAHFRRSGRYRHNPGWDSRNYSLGPHDVPCISPNIEIKTYSSDVFALVNHVNQESWMALPAGPEIGKKTHTALRRTGSSVNVVRLSAVDSAIAALSDGVHELNHIWSSLSAYLPSQLSQERSQQFISMMATRLLEQDILHLSSPQTGFAATGIATS